MGFTLIEMMVALALLGFISLLVFESLRFGQRSYESATRKGAQFWEVFAAQRLLRNLVETAYPQQTSNSLPPVEPGLRGDARRMFVTAAAPLALGGASLYRYEVTLRPNGAGQNDLVIRWQAQISDATGSQSPTAAEEILLEDVADLHVSYQNATGWTERWTEPGLPRLVRMRVTFGAGDLRKWPDMLAMPRITDDANCAFDVVAQRCRRST